ncbi:MAG: TraX family protein [Candidatus Izemoplasmatales bacterium]|nr:TraX family protein [Candidatus Izemoplasmatales bacterium]
MNRMYFKIIAAVTMVFDHIAVIFLSSDTLAYDILRSIGRLAFVMFAYMLAEGFHHTKSIKNYLLRLGIIAVIVEVFLIGYYFVSDINMIITFSIFLTLFVGLFSLYLFYHENQYLKILIVPLVFASELLNLSYGAYGVLMILFFGIYRDKVSNLVHLIFLNLMFTDKPLFAFLGHPEFGKYPAIQWFSMFAIVFIFIYNGKQGKYKLKWFYYVFYPGHLALLYLIDLIF